LVGAVDELRGKLEAFDRERNAAMCLSEEREEQAWTTRVNLMSKIPLLFPLDCQFLDRGMFNFSSW
jgi:hypothetical protein